MNADKPPDGLPIVLRRALTLATAAALSIFLSPAVAAQADSSTSLTVVGTSDVSDSGLVQTVIQPQFQSAYPGFTFKYVGTATGTAITDAETGVNGPSVLIVHAASLENQFVANGYSYEPYGRAIWINDFVLAGPPGDPAGVVKNAPNNIAQAFADIAAAGINGGSTTPKVTFVSRGGTPGTTVEEHAIWALVQSSGLGPAGLDLCAVPAADGGGMTPVTVASGLSGQPCGTGLPPASALPDWYVTSGLTQGPNVVAANACTGYNSPAANSCYVLTDRGTYDYLSSGLDPAGNIPGLTIVTRGPQPANVPGGPNFLVNYFHAYIINPSKCTACQVNLPAAQDFVNLITSPAVQSQLHFYLNDTGDTAGAPFVADASPGITVTGFPSHDAGGKAVTVTGTVTNQEIGYPVLSGKTVSVDRVVGGVDLPVPGATTTTSATGTYTITFVPPASGGYQVTTPQISQIEEPSLNPVFGDLLSPGASATSIMTVGAIPNTTVSLTKLSATRGRVSVTGTLRPAPVASGARIELFAFDTKTSARLKEIAKTSVGKGKTKFTIKAKLKRGARWIVQLEYVQKGKTSVYSKLGSIYVH